MKNENDYFQVLRKVYSNPKLSQRKLADDLEISLGKVNYCLKELKKKGLIKIDNFKKNPKKTGYLYILTPKGIAAKTKLTLKFIKRKSIEFEELKNELSKKN